MSSTRRFTVTNNGDTEAEVSSISITPTGVGFTYVPEQTPPFMLPGGQDFYIDVTAESDEVEAANALLSVDHSGSNSPLTKALTANFVSTPPTVPPPVLWYDASAIIGLTDNQDIPVWEDLSGSSFDMIKQSASGPKYRTNIQNGLPAVYINEFPPYWMRTNVITVVVRTVILVCRINKPTFTNDYGLGGGPCFVSGEGGQRGELGATAWHIEAMNPTSGPVQYYMDGVSDPTAQAGLLSPHVYCFSNVEPELTPGQYLIGVASTLLSSFGIDCHIFEIRCYDEILTSDQQAVANAELAAKWGI